GSRTVAARQCRFQNGLRAARRRARRLGFGRVDLQSAKAARTNRADDIAFLRAPARDPRRADDGREPPHPAAATSTRSGAAQAASTQLDARAAAEGALPPVETLHQRSAADRPRLCYWRA